MRLENTGLPGRGMRRRTGRQRRRCGALGAAAVMWVAWGARAGAQTVPNPVAMVDGRPISAAQYLAAAQGVSADPAALTAAQRQSIITTLISEQVLSDAAKAQGLAGKPAVRERLSAARRLVLSDAALQAYLAGHPVSESEIRAEYDKDVAQLPKQLIEIRHILLTSQSAAQAAIRKIRGGASFASVAQAESTDPLSKSAGGGTYWLGVPRNIPYLVGVMEYGKFLKAVSVIPAGQVGTQPIATSAGYNVVKVLAVRNDPPLPYDKARARVEQSLQAKLANQYVASLEAKATIKRLWN
jgi:peptidyl-prolyl cis-trans isomerase C